MWIYPTLVFLISRLFLIAIGLATLHFYTGPYLIPRLAPDTPLLDIWARWDSGWYLSIVQNSYFFSLNQQSSVAFFPLYPITAIILNGLLNHVMLSAWLVSNLSFLIGLVFCYKFVQEKFDNEAYSKLAIIIICSLPNSFFFSAIYSEGLFFALLSVCMYSVIREKWGIAAVCAALASATRLIGVVMWVFLMLAWIEHYWGTPKTRKIWGRLALIQLAPLGLLSYMAYLWRVFGNPFVFLDAQSHWEQHITNPINVLYSTAVGILSSHAYWWPAPGDFAVVILCMAMLRRVWKYLGISYCVTSLLMILIPLSSTTLSFNRFALVIVPVFIALSTYSVGKWTFRYSVFFSATGMALVYILFVLGKFIA